MKTASAWFFMLLVASLPFAASAQITIATPAATQWFWLNSLTSDYLSRAVGQTLVAPDSTHTRLVQFNLRAASASGYSPADFTTYVAQWDAGTQQVVGAPLWTSSLQSAAGLPVSSTGGSLLSFDTGGINLTAGQTYLLLAIAAPQVYSDPTKMAPLGVITSNSYAEGSLLWFTNGAATLSYANLSTANIENLGAYNYDLAFGATFSEPSLSAVPESSMIAAAFGIAFVTGLFVLRRRQANEKK